MSIFDFLSILHNKTKSWSDLTETEQKEFNPFMIGRWLSMDMNYCEFINEIQQYTIGILDKKTVFLLYKDLLPYKKKYFIKYYKGEANQKYNPEMLNILTEYFKDSKYNIKELLNMIFAKNMQNEIILPILKMYGKSDREIATLLKIKN